MDIEEDKLFLYDQNTTTPLVKDEIIKEVKEYIIEINDFYKEIAPLV